MTNGRQGSTRRRAVGAALVWLTILAWAGPAIAEASNAASKAASTPALPIQARATKTKKAPAAPVKLVDINSASRKELKTLPGIGDAEAEKIIANRPYLSKTELVGKNVLPIGPYLSLKNKIIAKQKNTRKVVAP
jgi:DNA uptake protein ComE-like DNA-binding protein